MANVANSFQNLAQIDRARDTINRVPGIEYALIAAQAAFDRAYSSEPTGYTYMSNSRVSGWYSNGDRATLYGQNLLGNTRQMSQLDYQFADGATATLMGAITSTANGAISGRINQTILTKPGAGSITLYGTSDISGTTATASSDITLTKIILQTNDAQLELNGIATAYVWDDGAYYHASYEGRLSSLNLTQAGQSLQISGLSYLSDSDNTLFSSAEATLAALLKGNDTVTAYGAGGDIFGFDGNDTLIGTAGIDTAIFSGARSNYSVSKTGNDWIVSDTVSSGGSDRLVQVERLQFSDGKVALDLTAADSKSLMTAKILGAVFGAASVANTEYAGIGIDLLDAGMSHADLMKLALDARLGAGFSNTDAVNLLYGNLVGYLPPNDDLNFYVNSIESGMYTQVSLAIMAADLDLNLTNIDLVGLSQTGLAYQ